MATKILNVGYDSTNYYLLGNPGPQLLVDIGWPGTFPKFAHALQRYGLQAKNIPYAIATHYHPDHAGLAEDVKRQGVKLVVMENQVGTISSFGRYMKPGQQFNPISLGDNFQLAFAESRNFLAKLGLTGEIIPTPGHSDDSVTLILDEGLAFTGDLHPQEFATEEQMESTSASWGKIRSFHVHTIYPGHGPTRQIR